MTIMTSKGIVMVYNDDLFRAWFLSKLRPIAPQMLGEVASIMLMARPNFSARMYFVKGNDISESIEIKRYGGLVVVIVNGRVFLGEPWLVETLVQSIMPRDINMSS